MAPEPTNAGVSCTTAGVLKGCVTGLLPSPVARTCCRRHRTSVPGVGICPDTPKNAPVRLSASADTDRGARSRYPEPAHRGGKEGESVATGSRETGGAASKTVRCPKRFSRCLKRASCWLSRSSSSGRPVYGVRLRRSVNIRQGSAHNAQSIGATAVTGRIAAFLLALPASIDVSRSNVMASDHASAIGSPSSDQGRPIAWRAWLAVVTPRASATRIDHQEWRRQWPASPQRFLGCLGVC